eukprot:RCo039053
MTHQWLPVGGSLLAVAVLLLCLPWQGRGAPCAVVISGRQGTHAFINRVYFPTDSLSQGRPVYTAHGVRSNRTWLYLRRYSAAWMLSMEGVGDRALAVNFANASTPDQIPPDKLWLLRDQRGKWEADPLVTATCVSG